MSHESWHWLFVICDLSAWHGGLAHHQVPQLDGRVIAGRDDLRAGGHMSSQTASGCASDVPDLDHSIGGASGELLIAGLERDAPAHDITDVTVDDTPPYLHLAAPVCLHWSSFLTDTFYLFNSHILLLK